MRARHLMTADPRVVTVDQHAVDAARIMRDLNVGCVPVVRDVESKQLAGVVTDRDLVIRCLAEGHLRDCPITEHMTPAPLDTVGPDTDVMEVMGMMERDQLRRILVTEGDRLVGIIAQADLALKEGPSEPLKVEELLERVSAPSVPLRADEQAAGRWAAAGQQRPVTETDSRAGGYVIGPTDGGGDIGFRAEGVRGLDDW